MQYNNKVLLPAGFHDLLPPDAAIEARSIAKMMNLFYRHGYQQVKPPLIEFESSLTGSQGKALSNQTFRLMDPISHETMAIRADMTTQVARIASSRLSEEPLPLRLCYSGQVCRVKGGGLYAERQLAETGIELIGSSAAEADAEVISIAAEALAKLRIKDVSIDFSLPRLAQIILDEYKTPERIKSKILDLINKKDFEGIAEISGRSAELIVKLLALSGPAKKILPGLNELGMPKKAKDYAKRLDEVISLASKANPNLKITVDPLEYRGFEYHTGISFSIFSKNAESELARGGHYEIADWRDSETGMLEACGITFYVNTMLRALPKLKKKPMLYLPLGTSARTAGSYREKGHITIMGLEKVKDSKVEAKRLGCGFYLEGGKVKEI